jgi:two-component system cell cycle response regulator
VAKTRVLIVDDDDVVRTHLAGLLTQAEYVVQQLPSAIGVTRTVVQEKIDVVVLDIMMPSLPGDKLAAMLRQNSRLKSLGVVLISGRPVAELQALAELVDADGVVTKAEVKTKLVAAIEQAARRRKLAAAETH